MSRYSRHIILSEIGQKGQEKLNNSKVLVIGSGGLGCPVLQYLGAAGVGTLGIVDFDVVEESNLQRQILFGSSSLGKNKALAAKERLHDLNSEIIINAYPVKLTTDNAKALFLDYDIVVDGTDNFTTRYLINDVSILTGKPLVYGAIHKFEGQVSVFNYLKGPSYRCIFPSLPKEGSYNCYEVGVLGVLPGIIGTMQANEVLKLILGIGDLLSGKLLCYNALDNSINIINFSRCEEEVERVLQNDNLKETSVEVYQSLGVDEITISQALTQEQVQFIDVRDYGEYPKIEYLNAIHIPLSELKHHIHKIDKQKNKIIFCKLGNRSKDAITILKKMGIKKCHSLKGGVMALQKHIKQNKK